MHNIGAYLKRLGLHGSKLVWRVFMILIPVIGYSLWQAFKQMLHTQKELHDYHDDRGENTDGTPKFGNINHPLYEYYWGED